MNANNQSILTEEDLASTVLCDLKRVVREYATAATESTCPTIRQMFTDLTNKALTMQGQLFTAMEQANMYQTSAGAPKQEITKQIQSYKSTNEKTKTWLSGVQQGNQMQNNIQNQSQNMNNNTQQGSQSFTTMH